MAKISVNTEKGINLNKIAIRKIIAMVVKDTGFKLIGLDFNFISSATMLSINNDYLGHNYDTDIITFDYSTETNNLDGEIFISLQEAINNSKKYRVTVDNEVVRLLVHGILHLIGYDDITVPKQKKMKKIENELVLKYKRCAKGLIKK
jgi:probable rRNA maturation factor